MKQFSMQPHPNILNVESYVGWGELFMLSPLPCLHAFSWSAIPTSRNIFLILFMSLLLAAGACLKWSLPSITEQQVCASSVDVCSIGYRIIDQAPFKHWVNNGWWRLFLSPCTPTCISAILSNNYIFWRRRWRERKTFSLSGDFLVWFFSCHWGCCFSCKHSKIKSTLL